MITEAELETRFPSIPWRTPVPVQTPTAKGLGCRYCIAQQGLKGTQVGTLPQNQAEFEQHMRLHHPQSKAIA